jgi:hypothetical protein
VKLSIAQGERGTHDVVVRKLPLVGIAKGDPSPAETPARLQQSGHHRSMSPADVERDAGGLEQDRCFHLRPPTGGKDFTGFQRQFPGIALSWINLDARPPPA